MRTIYQIGTHVKQARALSSQDTTRGPQESAFGRWNNASRSGHPALPLNLAVGFRSIYRRNEGKAAGRALEAHQVFRGRQMAEADALDALAQHVGEVFQDRRHLQQHCAFAKIQKVERRQSA